MNDTSLRLFSPEDFSRDVMMPHIASGIANRILSERLSVGVVDMDDCEGEKDGFTVWDDRPSSPYTHRIHYYMVPLKDEEPECDHESKRLRVRIINQTDPYDLGSWEKMLIENDFCPKCGKKLNE